MKATLILLAIGAAGAGYWLLSTSINPFEGLIVGLALLVGGGTALVLAAELVYRAVFAVRERLTGKPPPLSF